ncbi:MAG: hypothetical protein H0W50_05095 [Parachlamydiaceae bacterium]|nr:hypothetical protein [Parachlamydiaceae bacterium]
MHHAIGMVAIPIIGFFSPEIAAKKFKGCQNAKIEDLQEQNDKITAQKTKNEILKNKLDSVKQTLGNKKQKINKLEKNHIRSEQNILKLKNDIISLNNEIVSKDDKILISGEKNAAQELFIAKLMAEVELKNQQLSEKNQRIKHLEEDEDLEYPNNDIEHEEELEALNQAHAKVIKSYEEERVASNLDHAKVIKSKDSAFDILKLKYDERGQTINKHNSENANRKTIDKTPKEEVPKVAQGRSLYTQLFLSLVVGFNVTMLEL